LSNLQTRLITYLKAHGQPTETEVLTADASTREYFRVRWEGEVAVACVYPDDAGEAPAIYVDTTRLFLSADLPVARVLSADIPAGIIIQEDLGDRILRDELVAAPEERREELLNKAITLIARIQKATDAAYATNAIASTLRFDVTKLSWELDYFKEHYFETYRKRPLTASDDAALTADFIDLSLQLEARASVLCHRDFHAANLMLDRDGEMRIIDHQDARIGSVTYDLVSLLLDRVTLHPGDDWLSEKKRYFLDKRAELGLPKINETEFNEEFDLQTIQRCLKATGTFSYQSVKRGKTYFIPYIQPMLKISRAAAERLGRFDAIREIIGREIERSDA
jgi:aminoglycoside/choline kinase family phosphotransferase